AVRAEAVPYGHYRDAWGQLAVREAKDTPAETWRLLPGLEAECKAAFLTATEGGLSKAAVLDQVKSLLRQHADRQAEEAAKAKAAAAAEAAAKAEQERKAREESRAAQEKAQQTKQAAEQAKDQ